MTYSSPSRSIRVPMLVASDEATSGSVIAKADRISPSSSGVSHSSFCAGEPNSENLYTFSYDELTARGLRALPANLLEAIGELEADPVLRESLGRGRGEDYLDYYAKVKRDEWFRYHEQVTPWEINEYLTRF